MPKNGKMPEWSNGAVSKTVDLLWGSKGSNPFLSAATTDYQPSLFLSQRKAAYLSYGCFFYLVLLQFLAKESFNLYIC